jgi:hypothetical protein
VLSSASQTVGSSQGASPDLDDVSDLLRQAAYFPLFSVADPSVPNKPLPSPRRPNALIGMEVHEQMHRFDILTAEPDIRAGIRARNRVGEQVASIHIDWRVIPDNYVAKPGEAPPPTELDPTRPQRFAMYNGEFDFLDSQKSGFHGFGAGRTFPVIEEGQPHLRIGAVVDILEGFGRLQGLQGNVVVNGYITPPNSLDLHILLRLVDPARRLKARSTPAPLRPFPAPDPGATFLMFLGEADPDNPIVLKMTPQGRVLGATVYERLRLVHSVFQAPDGGTLATRTEEGAIAGSLRFDLEVDSQDPRVPVPFTTRNAVFTFFDRRRKPVGSLKADIVEGRGFATDLPGAPQPVLRMAGFGPFQGGTGPFAGVSGMLSVNGCISIPARTPSLSYSFRIADPAGAFRQACA